MKLHWQIVKLQLKEAFSISYGTYTFREALIISISKNNIVGYGECTAIDYYAIDLKFFQLKLEYFQTLIEKQTIKHPTEFYIFLETLNLHSFLRSALDCAYWDLYGKLERKSFLALNSYSYKKAPDSSITISVDTLEKQLEKIKNSDWNNFKVKCASYTEDAIHKLLDLEKNIALDANCSFTVSDCKLLENASLARKFSYIEQPLNIGLDNFSNLNANKSVNWMADEDCQDLDSLALLQTHYTSINLKLVKVGGLTPALKMIESAKTLNFKIMIGCMTESTIGISAGIVLTPFADFIDLDGANLISNDLANGSSIDKGKVIIKEAYGLGISIK
jgi:L-alanine-DL-glutamate epimerase-like enolase superfamily enzyme